MARKQTQSAEQQALAELMQDAHTALDRVGEVAAKFEVSPSHLEELVFQAIEDAAE